MKLEKITFIIGISALLIACSNSPAPVQMRVSGGYIQYNAGYGWQDLIDMESLRGAARTAWPAGTGGNRRNPRRRGTTRRCAHRHARSRWAGRSGQPGYGSLRTPVPVHRRSSPSMWRNLPTAVCGAWDSTYECEKCGAVVTYSYKYKQPGTAGGPGSPAPSLGRPARPGIYRSPVDAACVDAYNTAHPAAYPASFPDAD